MKSTGNPFVDGFLTELDRRIDSPDSPHSPAQREIMRKMRPALQLLAMNDTAKFAQSMKESLDEMFKT